MRILESKNQTTFIEYNEYNELNEYYKDTGNAHNSEIKGDFVNHGQSVCKENYIYLDNNGGSNNQKKNINNNDNIQEIKNLAEYDIKNTEKKTNCMFYQNNDDIEKNKYKGDDVNITNKHSAKKDTKKDAKEKSIEKKVNKKHKVKSEIGENKAEVQYINQIDKLGDKFHTINGNEEYKSSTYALAKKIQKEFKKNEIENEKCMKHTNTKKIYMSDEDEKDFSSKKARKHSPNDQINLDEKKYISPSKKNFNTKKNIIDDIGGVNKKNKKDKLKKTNTDIETNNQQKNVDEDKFLNANNNSGKKKNSKYERKSSKKSGNSGYKGTLFARKEGRPGMVISHKRNVDAKKTLSNKTNTSKRGAKIDNELTIKPRQYLSQSNFNLKSAKDYLLNNNLLWAVIYF